MNQRFVLARLVDVASFQHWQTQIASIHGWLDDLEGWLLHLLAAERPATGPLSKLVPGLGCQVIFPE